MPHYLTVIVRRASLAALILTIAFDFSCKSSSNNAGAQLIEIPRKADGTIDYDKLPTMSFPETIFDFGHFKKNVKVKHTFIFKNTGHVPLILSDVTTSCGCTTPKWPHEPIKPGATDSIRVEYNSEGRPGAFNKGITIISNTYPNQTIIAIKGYADN